MFRELVTAFAAKLIESVDNFSDGPCRKEAFALNQPHMRPARSPCDDIEVPKFSRCAERGHLHHHVDLESFVLEKLGDIAIEVMTERFRRRAPKAPHGSRTKIPIWHPRSANRAEEIRGAGTQLLYAKAAGRCVVLAETDERPRDDGNFTQPLSMRSSANGT